MLHIALCDDDAAFLEKMSALLQKQFLSRGTKIKLTTFSGGKKLIESVEKIDRMFDVIFLDVQMPEVDGFAVAKRIRELNATNLLIFTTFMENDASEGYKYDAFRYIRKSRLEEEVIEAVNKIILRFHERLDPGDEIELKKLLGQDYETFKVNRNDILYFEIDKTRRVKLKTIHGEYYLLVKPMKYYFELMQCDDFIVVVRSFVVNMNHIEDYDNQYFYLPNGKKIELGNTKRTRDISVKRYLQFLRTRV